MAIEEQKYLMNHPSSGDDMLAELCRDWEESSNAAKESGINVIHIRTGIVMSPLGGALGKVTATCKDGCRWSSWWWKTNAILDFIG